MLASQEGVLSPGNEGSMAVIVYISIFPRTLLYLCSYANFRAFLFGATLVHALHRETTGVLNGSPQSGFGFGLWIGLLLYLWDLVAVQG